MDPRIYIYKITFDNQPYWYWGVHKEKKFDEEYYGSPVSYKDYWKKFTPRKEIIEFFEYSQEGWDLALAKEKEIIRQDFSNPLCLNRNCGGKCSPEITREYWSIPENRQKASERSKNLWEDPDYRERHLSRLRSPESRKKRSSKQKEVWQDPSHRVKVSKAIEEMWENTEYREKQAVSRSSPEYLEGLSRTLSNTLTRLWSDSDFRKRQSESAKEMWETPEIREKLLESMNNPRTKEERSRSASERLKKIWEDEEYRKKVSDRLKSCWEDPTYRGRVTENQRKTWSDSELRRLASERQKKRLQDPEVKLKRSGWTWITDGTKGGNKQLPKGSPIPEGYRKGRTT